ncbi:MAG: AbrB/MazE/SpoVT family DNA-binding domain-containing protein, partial [Chloroflexi bacterium]|nr:AbrB/MazE/SpoVT family DNA-binding domain-containing protein [Chloroflexota bacterium]
METVLLNPKYTVTIPRALRKAWGIRPGQKIQVIQYGDRLELIPLKPIK